jgi:hypothetical protein
VSITFGPLTPLSNQAVHVCKQPAAGLQLIGNPIRIIGLSLLREGFFRLAVEKLLLWAHHFFLINENPSLDGVSGST